MTIEEQVQALTGKVSALEHIVAGLVLVLSDEQREKLKQILESREVK